MEKEVKRGYVKWTDEDGVFHKEPLADHPDLLGKASAAEQLRAEEVRRLNAAAESAEEDRKDSAEDETREVLKELKAAPEEVLTAAALDVVDEPAGAASEPVKGEDETPSNEPIDEEHAAALEKLREETSK